MDNNTTTKTRGPKFTQRTHGSAKLINKTGKLHPMAFNRAMSKLLAREHKAAKSFRRDGGR
jgi:hypothetical protein